MKGVLLVLSSQCDCDGALPSCSAVCVEASSVCLCSGLFSQNWSSLLW